MASNKESYTINLHKEFNNSDGTTMVFYVVISNIGKSIYVFVYTTARSCLSLLFFAIYIFLFLLLLLFTLRCEASVFLSSHNHRHLLVYFHTLTFASAIYMLLYAYRTLPSSLLLVKTLANLFICLLVENFQVRKERERERGRAGDAVRETFWMKRSKQAHPFQM